MDIKTFLLKRPTFSDYENIRKLESDPLVMQYTSMRVAQTEEQSHSRLGSQIELQPSREPFGIWLAEEAKTNTFIGWFILHPLEDQSLELGYMIVKDQWGKKWTSKIVQHLIEYAKSHKIKKLVARTDSLNKASSHILKKFGFIYVSSTTEKDKTTLLDYELQRFELELY